MKHPLYTLDDGTEITASSIRDGKARICVEKYDNDLGTFQTAVFSIPVVKVRAVYVAPFTVAR